VWTLLRIIPSISVVLLIKYKKTAAESLDTKYDLKPATCHKLDIDSGRTKDSGARLTYEPSNYVTTIIGTNQQLPKFILVAMQFSLDKTIGILHCRPLY
jgi:hypothetical protein